jgi:hypothetical protein
MLNPFKKRPPAPANDDAEAEAMRKALVPRIKHLAFERELSDRGIPPEYLPVTEPLAGELLVTFAFDLPDQFVMANPTNLASAGIAPGEARALACANLRPRVDALTLAREGDVVLATTGGHWEACLLLLDDFWAGADRQFESGYLVCAPRRDRLLVSAGLGAPAIAEMQAAAHSWFAATYDAHALSTQLMARQGTAWALHTP